MPNKIDTSTGGTIKFYLTVLVVIALAYIGYSGQAEQREAGIRPQDVPPPEWTPETVLIFILMAWVVLWIAGRVEQTGGDFSR